MHRASWRSYLKIVKLLLEAGADLTIKNSLGRTPLIQYAYKILDLSYYPNQELDKAVRPRSLVFKLMVDAGADVNASDLKGRTSLYALAFAVDQHLSPRSMQLRY